MTLGVAFRERSVVCTGASGRRADDAALRGAASMTLTGRIGATPAQVWHEEVLEPQFVREAGELLPWYVAIEKVLLLEYVRMGLCPAAHAAALAARLDELQPDRIAADPAANMSDIAFAVERYVAAGPVTPFPAWHVDRSRNDLQACAQMLAVRQRLLDAVDQLGELFSATLALAERTADLPMPGNTHLQPAQVISPGFWLTALSAETLRTLRRLRATYAEVDVCPLGGGAMAGQELAWDPRRMAALLGCAAAVPHALVAVASRGWALSIAGDLSGYGVTLSRFATDLMTWGSGEVGFLDLPDAVRSTLRLLTTVLTHARLRDDRMRAACERDYLGGLRLANRLTLTAAVPWRDAQVIAGRYVVAALERGLPPGQPDGALLAKLLADGGYATVEPTALLVEAFDVPAALRGKRTPGSTHPDAVRRLLGEQLTEYGEVAGWAADRRTAVAEALSTLDAELAAGCSERS